MLHQRLLNESAHLGTEEILRQLPADQRPALEQSIHQAVRQAVLDYAHGLATLSRQLYPSDTPNIPKKSAPARSRHHVPSGPRTTKLYDRTSDQITLDEVLKIVI
jgi:hypothetical protein